MITEDYVSFETAKLLKEKGFDGNTFYKYANKEGVVEEWYDDYRERMVRFNWNYGTLITPPTEPHDKYRVYGDTIPAPSLALAMKWLREVYHIGVFPSTYCISFDNQVTYPYGTCIVNLDTHEIMLDDCMARTTYEQACEAAIKYCLENLI